MPRRLVTITMWGALALLAVACRSCWLPDRSLGRTLAPADVVGTWRMTASSLALLARDGHGPAGPLGQGGTSFPPPPPPPGRSCTVTFAEDGTAEFASIPCWGAEQWRELTGTWELLHRPTWRDDEANVLHVSLHARGGGRNLTIAWSFDEVDGALVLWEYLGDPDSWEFVEYVRDP